jgi:predicted kinase
MKPTLYVLVGMIASGKSTWSRAAAEDGTIVVNDDALTLALHAGHYKFERKHLAAKKLIMHHMVRIFLERGCNVIVDAPNYDSHSRRLWVELGKLLGAHVVFVVFDRQGPFTHAQRRFIADARGLTFEKWLEVAVEHNRHWEPPLATEGQDETWHLLPDVAQPPAVKFKHP